MCNKCTNKEDVPIKKYEVELKYDVPKTVLYAMWATNAEEAKAIALAIHTEGKDTDTYPNLKVSNVVNLTDKESGAKHA